MQLRIVWRIQSAVESITTCTAPRVQVGGVMAVANRLNSPYFSRRVVEYQQAVRLPAGAVFAASGCHALVVGVDKPEEAVPAFPLGGLVTAWEGDFVPIFLVQPIYTLARRLGLRPEEPHRELIAVHVLSPVLAGWHYRRPVFWAARGEDNAPAVLEGEPAYRQGNLLVGWCCGEDIPTASSWERWSAPVAWFFNHAATESREERAMKLVPPEAVVSPVAVIYQGVPHAAVRFDGGRVVARDHEDIVVPQGNWVAIHPFRARGGVVD